MIYKGQSLNERVPYTLSELIYPASATILQKSNELPAAIELNAGKGKITVIASPYGVTEQPQCELPVKVKEEMPLDKPYPILNHVKVLMGDIFSSVQLFETNPELEPCNLFQRQWRIYCSDIQRTLDTEGVFYPDKDRKDCFYQRITDRLFGNESCWIYA